MSSTIAQNALLHDQGNVPNIASIKFIMAECKKMLQKFLVEQQQYIKIIINDQSKRTI